MQPNATIITPLGAPVHLTSHYCASHACNGVMELLIGAAHETSVTRGVRASSSARSERVFFKRVAGRTGFCLRTVWLFFTTGNNSPHALPFAFSWRWLCRVSFAYAYANRPVGEVVHSQEPFTVRTLSSSVLFSCFFVCLIRTTFTLSPRETGCSVAVAE